MSTRWKIPDGFGPLKRAEVARDKLGHFPRLRGDHPKAWAFPDYLDSPSSRWLQSLKEMYAMPISFPASVSPEAGLMLHGLVRNLRPRVVLEVGTFLSVSTHWMASAMQAGEGGVVHCFDDFGPVHRGPWRDAEMLEGRLDWVRDRLGRAGLLDMVRFHPGDSAAQIALAREELAAAGGVDFAYIDGDHSVEGMTRDLWAVEPVLNTGGYVMVHDIYPDQCGGHEGPRHVLDRVATIGAGVYEKVELYTAPLNYGMGLMRRVG